MSADNGIYILNTTSIWQFRPDGAKISDHSTRPVWRVAHIQAIDNLNWYKENQPYNVGAYLLDNWGRAEVFYSKEEAWDKAREMAAEVIKYAPLEYGIEYGISEINMLEYHMLGD